jgi:hypothetical protein
MITNFDDFCTWTFVVIDDICQQLAPYFRRPGPAPDCSDSELLTMILVGECRGWGQETDLLSNWRDHRDLFPHIPSQSRFNRRRRQLAELLNLIRRVLLELMDAAQDRQCVLDSLPVPVIAFHLVPGSSAKGAWQAFGASYGRVSSKKQTIFGYKLHLLITLGGIILDFELVPAHVSEIEAGAELLAAHTDLEVLGDKGFINAAVQQQLRDENRVRLYTLPRSNQTPLPTAMQHLHNALRQIIETVNGQLAGQLQIEKNYAHSFAGLCARLYSKLTAHTLCIYLNKLLGNEDFLQIKALAFPAKN